MAKVSHSNRQSQLAGQGYHAMPAIIPHHALKGRKARTVNGHDHYYDELEYVKMHFKFLVTGGYLKDEVTSIDETIAATVAARETLEKNYDEVKVMHHPRYENGKYDGYMVAVNWLRMPEGTMWHAYKHALDHPPMTRDAVISGLYLLNKMGFCKINKTYDFEWFQDPWHMDEIEEDETLKEWKDEIRFYKKDPIKLAFHERAFHYHAGRNTALGDWLRCCWHYRDFDWFKFEPVHLMEDGEQPVTMWDNYRIIYDYTGLLIDEAVNRIDNDWANGGSIHMADYRCITSDKVIHEEFAPTKAERDKLRRDFTKLWMFDIAGLKYDLFVNRTYDSHGKMKEAIPDDEKNVHLTIIPNEYDYTKRKLPPKDATHHIRGRKIAKAVRGTGRGKRSRRAGRKLAA